MRAVKQTVVDTIHVVAAAAVMFFLFAFVIARQEPAWSDFALLTLMVLLVSAVIARLINWSGHRLHK
jgi:hypothetical protein